MFPGILTQKGFKEHCANFMGEDILHLPSEPKKTMHKTDMYWKDQMQEVQMGWAHVNTTNLHNAFRKSSKNDAFVNDMQGKREGRYAEIKLPRTMTHADALALSDKLGSTSLGLTTTAGGFALRSLIEEELKAKALIDPEFASVVGPELMTAKLTDDNKYIIKGIDRHMSFIDIV